MLKSVNPNGETELYTDIGQFIGILPKNHPLASEFAEDGGPGSGNFGHKGRPGKVGGSGPGGGKQYRGGRADIGYFGSRKDWLNGLTGETQREGVWLIIEMKKDFESKLKAKNRIEELGKQGMLTPEQVENRLKEAYLDGIDPKMSIEEYTFKKGNAARTDQMLRLAREARNWDQYKDRLMNTNLTKEERDIYEALVKNEGRYSEIYGTF